MRIYFDENFSPSLVAGMKEIQDGRKAEGFTVHSVKDEFGKGAPDEKWIPGIASQHGCVITQDLQVNRTRAQWHLCKHNKIGVFFLKPPKKGWNYWTIVNLVVTSWSRIQEITKDDPRPFGYVLDSRGKFYHLE
jgi:PIN like domain